MLLELIAKWIEPIDLSGIGKRPRFRNWRWQPLIQPYLLLALIMVMGGALRFTGHNWDEGTMLHPDERYLVDLMTKTRFDVGIRADEREAVTVRSQECLRGYETTGALAHDCTALHFTIRREMKQPLSVDEQTLHCLREYPGTAGAGPLLDTACSPTNPHNAGSAAFAYGTLPLFMTRAVAESYDALLNFLGQRVTHRSSYIYLWHSDIASVGRALSSFFDLLSIGFIFLIGRQVHSRRAGLLAAAFYAFAPLPIQLSHFATVNAVASFFVVLALWFANRVARSGRWHSYIGFGFATAAATACRINLAPLAGVVALAFVYRMWQHLRTEQADGLIGNATLRDFIGLLLSAIVALAFFRFFNPYAFIGPALFTGLNERWLLDLQQSINLASGYSDFPPNWQWTGRLSYVYPLKDILLWGLGLSACVPAWFGVLRGAYRWLRGHLGSAKYLLLLAWIFGYFGLIGGSWVMTMRYYLPLYGALTVFGACAVWDAHSWLLRRKWRVWRGYRFAPSALVGGLVVLSLLWAVMFHNIYRQPLTRIQGSFWIQANIPADIAIRIADAPPETPLINITLNNRNSDSLPGDELLLQRSSIISDNTLIEQFFVAPTGGQVNELLLPHVGRRYAGDDRINLSFELLDEAGNSLARSVIAHTFPTDSHPLGTQYSAILSEPVTLDPGAIYWIRVEVQGGDLYLGGAIVSDEGAWDDAVTAVRSCRPDPLELLDECEYVHPYSAQILQYNMSMAAEDDEYKLENLLNGLARSDYISISSNRFYDSQARNPARFSLTNAYYRRLFSGELGFELVASFIEGYQLGPLRILDQRFPNHFPPTWLNQLEADEAFHVYDHPAVFIFQKTTDYDPQRTRALLAGVSLAMVHSSPYYGSCPHLDPSHNLSFLCTPDIANFYRLPPREIDTVPSQLLYSNEQLEIQTERSTWTTQFDLAGLLNRNHGLALVVWWLIIWLLGLIAWVPLYFMLPALADRGYGLARTMGMLALSWLAWMLASAQLPIWNGTALWFMAGIASLGSAALAWRKRAEFRTYLVLRWRTILTIELLTAALFFGFLLVRLSNPDLWHNVFGGEKMMDSAFLNGVLRSEIFPPINPWYAGSYINYYYFGFVMVGAPTLLSGIMPSVAYNLIIPTIFALTGIGTYSIAYNIAAGMRLSRLRPALAGIAAMSLMTLLGNLDTIHVWLAGVHKLGLSRLAAQSSTTITAIYEGLRAWLGGANLLIGGGEWMWNPTRVIGASINDNAISEFPFFTFLYGDLHAHMMALPILILTLAFVTHELLISGEDRRNNWQRGALLACWAITSGLSWAANSWDWAPFTLLSLVAIVLAWLRRWSLRIEGEVALSWRARLWSIAQQRTAVIEALIYLGGFVLLNLLATAPYRAWFATTSAEFEVWEGPFTPIWAYLSIHGHLLFLLLGLLLWISRNHIDAWRITSLARQPLAIASVAILAATGLALGIDGRSLMFLILPLLLWTAALLLRETSSGVRVLLLFAGLALGLTMMPELMRLRLDIGRQNTIFKLYFMGWLLFSIVGGVAFALLWNARRRWSKALRSAWSIAAFLLFISAAAYPILAIPARAAHRFEPSMPISLDGLEFMRYSKHWDIEELFPLEPDYQMIRWLLENVEGAPTIMEGRTYGSEYRWTSRISSFTGLPSVIGWQYHQQQQRTFPPMSELIQRRGANVTAFYTMEDIDAALEILRAYDVEYIILGPLEHALYDRTDETDPSRYVNGYAKFDTMIEAGMLEVVFELPYRYQTYGTDYPAVARILQVVAE